MRIEAGQHSADEIIAALREGRRVVVRTEMLGGDHEITLRHDGTTFYCDTPTTLHRHTEETAMRECIVNMGYGRGD
jgi:hemin uptake protein HemP